MATYIYNGDGEKEFPTLGLTVKNGDTLIRQMRSLMPMSLLLLHKRKQHQQHR